MTHAASSLDGDTASAVSIEAALLDDVAARQPLLATINVLLAAVVAAIYWPVTPGPLVPSWLATMLLGQAARLALWLSPFRSSRLVVRHKVSALIVGSALGGLGWGAFGVLFTTPQSDFHEMMRPFVLAGMIAGSVISLPAHLGSFFAFFVPALAPYAFTQLFDPGKGGVWLGMITIGFGIGIALVALQMHAILARSIGMGLRNGDLLADLRRARQELEARVEERTGELTAANAALLREVEDRRRSEQQVRFLLQHDTLTGIANRLLFNERLQQALQRRRLLGQGATAVLMIDLDEFKSVNDQFGHGAGDRVLVAVAERLQAALPSGDTVARLGGDEFAVVAADLPAAGDAVAYASRLKLAAEVPMRIEGREYVVGLTVGIAVQPEHGDDAETLLRRADLALYRAKERRLGVVLFDPGLERASRARTAMEQELHRALEHDEFRLHFQPRFAVATRELRGFEALLRWEHPQRGLLAPADFISAAETIGLMRPLGAWVVATACRAAAVWTRRHPSLGLSVNLSMTQLRDPHAASSVGRALEASGLAARCLELELPGPAYPAFGTEPTRGILAEMRRRGVSLTIDEFGAGNASLGEVRDWPFDGVKIDRAFVMSLGRSREDEAIVRSIVTLGKGLGRRVVAIGVETEEQLAFLREIGCDEAQGFLLGRPQPPEEIDKLAA